MKNRFLLLMLFVMTSVASWGWVNGEIITYQGIKYEIINAANRTLRARQIYADAADADGVVVVPYQVPDPLDPSKTFFVTNTYFHSSIDKTKPVKTVILSEGITTIQSNSFYNITIDKLYIPSTVNSITSMGSGTIGAIEVAPGNTNYKVGACGVDGCGDLYTYDGTKLVYHVKLNEAHTIDGTYYTPENLKHLEPCTFPGDTKINKIHFGPNVTGFTTGSGYELTGNRISAIEVDENNETFKSIDGVLYTKDGKTLRLYPIGKTETEFKVPDGVTTVSPFAIQTPKLKYIDLNQVETANLWGNAYLERVTLGASTKSVSITYNIRMKEFVVPAENSWYSADDGILFNKEKTKLVKCPDAKDIGEYTIPSTVTEIGRAAFYDVKPNYGGTQKEYKIIANSALTKIDAMAFQDSNISSADFSACTGLTSFGEECFKAASKLTSISIPAGVSQLNANLFAGCTNLTEVNIPAGSLKTIGTGAFNGLANLKNVNFAPGCGLLNINAQAFANNTGIEQLTLPKTVTYIGEGAFSNCTNLKTITFADDAEIKTIGKSAFAKSGITSISIPEGVTSIGAEAFESCDVLTEITLPSTVTSISGEAFKFCSRLGNVNVADGNTNYSAIDGMLLNKNKTTLVLFPPAKANDQFTLLPPSITALGDYSFYTCTNLKNVVIPNKVTSIGERTFGMCSNLNTITFLCDDMIPAANINQAVNKIAFDDDMFANININVRKGELSKYQNEPFYQKFKSINPSFENATEEYIAVSDNAVDMLSSTNTDLSYVIPATVTQDSKTYNVSMIGDYCFENASAEMNEVIVKGNVGYVGAKAFVKSSGTIDNIFFLGDAPADKALSTDRFELADTYNSFTSGQKVYVRRSQLEGYKSAFASQQSQVTYEIPTTDIMPNAECGSFAREFAVDLSNNGANNVNSPQFIAFVPMRLNSHDEDGGTVYTVRMQSINEGGAGDGTYIPAGTGVVLRKYGSSQPTYYEIAESQTSGSNGMSPAVICNSGQIPASTSWLWNYYIGKSDGKAHKATKDTSIGVHKSYLSIPVAAGAKAVTFSFSDIEDNATGVSLTKHESTEDGEWYSVTGQKTRRPSAGLFIRNGKKFIVK